MKLRCRAARRPSCRSPRSRPGPPCRTRAARPAAGHSRRGRPALPHAEQPADAVQRRRNVGIGVRAGAPGHRARLIYDGQRHPFLMVEGWHAPAGRRAGNPGLSPRPGSTGTAPPAGAKETWAPPTGRIPRQPNGVSRITGQGGTQATDPTPRPTRNPGSRAEALSTSSLPNIRYIEDRFRQLIACGTSILVRQSGGTAGVARQVWLWASRKGVAAVQQERRTHNQEPARLATRGTELESMGAAGGTGV
jgi:hypothetical protein